MRVFEQLHRLLLRFRYPVSLPEDIAADLGVDISNNLSLEQCIDLLLDPNNRPTHVKKFMPRDQAEKTFHKALYKERFPNNTLYSYYFNEGWLEVVLFFDDQSRLRRIYLQHNRISGDEGLEIPLHND